MENSKQKIKFGLSYILLDGEELLEDNVINMRDHFDFISVVLTEKSLLGIKPSSLCHKILNDLLKRGLIDKIVTVKHKSKDTWRFQIRNAALETLKKNDCDFGCVSDVDEFYEESCIVNCKKIIIDENLDIIYTYIKQYYADERYAFGENGRYTKTMCPFIFKITKTLMYGNPIKKNYPYMIDPTRYFKGNLSYRLISPDIGYMHHMWLVRVDVKTKFKLRAFIMNKKINNKSLNHWRNWKPGLPGMGISKSIEMPLYEQTHTIKLTNFYKYAKKR